MGWRRGNGYPSPDIYALNHLPIPVSPLVPPEAHPHTHSPNHSHYLTILTHALLYDQAPESTKAKDKDDIVRRWNALDVPKANVKAQASAHVSLPGATQTKKPAAKKPQQKKRKRTADSSEDESSDDEDDTCGQDEDMSCDEDGESEGEGGESGDESDCDDEELWLVKRILKKQVKKGKVEYQVEWEGEEWEGKYTWEPAENLTHTEALKEFLAR